MRAVKSVSIDSERRVIITYLDGSTETLYPNCIWCDSEALRQLIKDLLEEKADAITQTIENVTVATFSDGADEGMIKKLLVSIEPVQDLHEYDNPWPAGGGKNLIDYLYCVGLGPRSNDDTVFYATTAVDGILTFTGEASYVRGGMICKGIGAPTPPTTFTVSAEVKSTSTRIAFGIGAYEGGGTSDVDSSFTVTANTWVKISRTYSNVSYGKIGIFIQPLGDKDVLQVKNVQLESGTTATDYAPYSNICPISGRTGLSVARCGKNLLINELTTSTVNGVSFTLNVDSSITVSGTPTSMTRVLIKRGIVWDGRALAILSFGTMPTGTRVFARRIYDGAQSYPTVSPTAAIMVGVEIYDLCLEINTTFDGNTFTIYPQLELGSTATDYESYKGSTYSVNWETEAGTVYGGTLDVVSGKLVVDMAIVDMGSMVWNYNTTYAFFASTSISTRKIGILNVWSDMFKTMAGTWSGTPVQIALWGNESNITLYVQIPTLDNVDGFMALIDGHQLMYELATPITYQLTPQEVTTLLGTNNIWADSGNILELEYTADTKLYISEQQSGTSGALGSGRQEIVNHDIQTASEKTLEDVAAYKEDTDERGEK